MKDELARGMACRNEDSKSANRSPELRFGVWCAIAIAIVWLLTPVFLGFAYSNMTERAQSGDMFGSVNALFSGLAFAAVFTAILLQRSELRLQRKELRFQRQELERSASAQEDAHRALQKTIHAHAFKTAYDVLQAENIRDARRTVYHFADLPLEQWNSEAFRNAELVCNSFDIVGIMVRHDMLPVDYIADSWGDALRRTWPALQPVVERERRRRGAEEFWDDYEYLARAAIDRKST